MTPDYENLELVIPCCDDCDRPARWKLPVRRDTALVIVVAVVAVVIVVWTR